jgi:hypothetical protein
LILAPLIDFSRDHLPQDGSTDRCITFRTGASNSPRTNGCRPLPRFIAGVGARNALSSIERRVFSCHPVPHEMDQAARARGWVTGGKSLIAHT